MKAADALAMACIVYVIFALTPLLLMHTTHTAHTFGYILVGIDLLIIEIFSNDRNES